MKLIQFNHKEYVWIRAMISRRYGTPYKNLPLALLFASVGKKPKLSKTKQGKRLGAGL
jgi:hypothetical protein